MIVIYPLWQWPQQRPDLTLYLKHIENQTKYMKWVFKYWQHRTIILEEIEKKEKLEIYHLMAVSRAWD